MRAPISPPPARNSSVPRDSSRNLDEFFTRSRALLFDLGLFVGDVLAHHRIEFAHFHLVRMQPLVLHRNVEMAGAGRRQQFDFLAHGLILRSSRRARAAGRALLPARSSRSCAWRWW